VSGRSLALVRSAIDEEEGLVGVEQWAEVRRMKRVEGLSAREISRRTGLARDTVSRLLAAVKPPVIRGRRRGRSGSV
jgi:transposase